MEIKETVQEFTSKRKVFTYTAFDGSEFNDATQCRNHEDGLMRAKTKNIWVDISGHHDFWYMETQEILNWFIGSECGGHKKTENGTPLKVGDWVSVLYTYNSEHADDYDIVTLDDYISSSQKLSELKEQANV